MFTILVVSQRWTNSHDWFWLDLSKKKATHSCVYISNVSARFWCQISCKDRHPKIITTDITFIVIRESDWSIAVIWSHWPVFNFSMNLDRIHEGLRHSRQNYFCDTVQFEALNLHHEKSTLEKIVLQGLIWNTNTQCFYEEKWTACFTLHIHLYFQVEKQR